jgi:hypothetical protein
LGDHIQHCKAVFSNRIQLAIQALLHNLWQGVAVHFLGAGSGNANQILFRAWNAGRECAFWNWTNIFHAFGNFAGVINNDFPRGLIWQIIKFLQHLISCTEEEWCLIIRILKAHPSHQDFPKASIFLFHKVNITGGNDRNTKLFAEFKYSDIEVLNVLFTADLSIPYHEHIIT